MKIKNIWNHHLVNFQGVSKNSVGQLAGFFRKLKLTWDVRFQHFRLSDWQWHTGRLHTGSQGCEGMSILTSNMNVQSYTYTYNIYGIYDIYLPRFIIQNEKKNKYDGYIPWRIHDGTGAFDSILHVTKLPNSPDGNPSTGLFESSTSWWLNFPTHLKTICGRQNGWKSNPQLFGGEISQKYVSCHHPVYM